MAQVSTLFQLAASTAVWLIFVGACGGKSLDGEAEGNNESGQGNASTTAGKSAAAGEGAGSQGGTGGGDGGRGSIGATTNRAGSPSRLGCDGPSANDPNAPGGCAAAFPRWTHDAETGICMPFIYGGCGATENNYDSLAACQEACPNNRSINLDACETASDCVLTLNSCCGSFLASGFTAHDLIAHNAQFQNQLDRCATIDCAGGENWNVERKFFIAECVQRECRVTDLRTSDVTRCETAQDCRLRLGSGCCEGCGNATDLMAVRNDGSLEKLVCGDEIPPCLPCVGMIPASAVAVCDMGHCNVAYLE